MGCNAWNHPPDCNCGWGGATTWGSATSPVITSNTAPVSYADGRLWKTSKSASPNARCPICASPVYFVQTDNGGRVFFDELGPPWPKHPCTDNGDRPLAYSHSTAQTQLTQNKEWHLIQSPQIKYESKKIIVTGYCEPLRKHLVIATGAEEEIHIITPVFVKPFGESGAYEISYIFSRPNTNQLRTEIRIFYPITWGTIEDWKKAFDGDIEAATNIGWKYSFFWDKFGGEYDYAKDYKVAKYWFNLAAKKGDAVAMNNLGVLQLRGLGCVADMQSAEINFLKSALQMTSTAFGHLSKIYKLGREDEKSILYSQIFSAIERHLQLEDLEEDTGAESEEYPNSYCYAPHPIERYLHIETTVKISNLADFVPLWNIFWLTTINIDESLCRPADWHNIVNVARKIADTMLFDMDEEICKGLTLRNALRMHPRRFLHFFESADLSKIEVFKSQPELKQIAIQKAKDAAIRIKEVTGEENAKLIPLPFSSQSKS